ncbi:Forkhead-associated (FHA) domain-containing protein [Artemisia annua]|uniref:Forkhead-associated (FHA) domain-containing protein n=1 Tax=Artemisia annua TaxID=35608 RepID=A0A2U1Q1G0_ARTAN|nr:Forkhead-associated (FHA) domain-containing protein [Artemisia annua]
MFLIFGPGIRLAVLSGWWFNRSKTPVQFIDLEPHKPYTLGRDPNQCDYVFEHPQVSKTHCQLYFDDCTKKVFITDGVRVRVSLNGVFVDGVRVGNGESKELFAGSEVSFVCGSCFRVSFVVEEIVFSDSKLAYAGLLSLSLRECSADIGFTALNTLRNPIPQVDRRNLNKTHAQQNGKPSSSSQQSVIPQVSVPIINGNSRFETHCTWCKKEFLYQPVDPEIMTEACEFICRKCKQKICGVLERSL